ncbi:hypothetical protein DA897_20070 [Salmonella enterica]|uniref:Uncharacterized protein n=1 Tax=Salmonella enterica TaxID=28901 RepID=A0A639THW1_SALER|nr:hypothetical protein [Salmonella enterica]EBI0492320.1 hypothetical protein [Salmonella enterica subsp. enterica serovar Mississippi]ECU8004290.1 hypothetical protein [Salmonella enterica subsp. enterica serovar O rough]EAB3126666.1 hypothetical protein [Salmonella enterica]EAB4394806.1 hypothetical protein [Salmonella enterica]
MPKPDRARPERCFTVFGRIGVMPGQTGSNLKGTGAEKERMHYVNSDLVHPCNPASFHVAQYVRSYCQLR